MTQLPLVLCKIGCYIHHYLLTETEQKPNHIAVLGYTQNI